MLGPKYENDGKEKISELLEFVHSLYKIVDNYSDDPIQLEKELNNFYYINNEKSINLSNYFNSIENSVFPPGFFNDYLPKTERVNQEEFDISRSNLDQLAGLRLQKIPHKLNNNSKELEKGSLRKVLERIKQEKIKEGASKRTKFVYKKSKKVGIQLPNLPRDIKWEEVTMKFLNGDEVQITAKGLVLSANYELMGFKDEKTKNPNLQWKFLKGLSLVNGFLNWDNNKNMTTKERNSVKKRKQELSEALKIYFHTIKEDPFFDYKKEDGYRIKIQLIPEHGSNFKNTNKIISSNINSHSEDIDTDNQDFFNEQTSDPDNW